eukprot:1144700-Pelagomonas_calceolata.AAC.3
MSHMGLSKKNSEPQGARKERQKERQARPTRKGKGEGARYPELPSLKKAGGILLRSSSKQK